jgi:hypothetical protein
MAMCHHQPRWQLGFGLSYRVTPDIIFGKAPKSPPPRHPKASMMKATGLHRQRAMCAAMLLPDEPFQWSGSAHPGHAKGV